MPHRFYRFFTIFTGLLLAAGMTATPSVQAQTQATAPAVREIRIAVPDLGTGTRKSFAGIVDVLRERQTLERTFAADGIAVKWLFFKGAGPAINEAFANGQVDFAYLGDLAAIIGRASGFDSRLLSAVRRHSKSYLAVVPGSGIRTLEDLKGKRIALFRGTANQLSLAAVLASRGMKESDLQIINMDVGASVAALAARRIDATWGTGTLYNLYLQGLAELPLNTRDFNNIGGIQTVLVGAGRFVDAHPDLVAKLLAAQQTGFDWLASEANRTAYIDLVERNSEFPRALVENDLKGERMADVFNPKLDKEFLAALQASVNLAAQIRLIRRPFEVQDWIYSPGKPGGTPRRP